MPQDLRKIRERKGMSLDKLASRSGISIATLIQYERGEQEIPVQDLGRLARVLYVDEWDINPRSSPPPRDQPPSKPRPPKRDAPPREGKKEKGEQKAKKPLRQSPPARDTQITHLLTLAARFDIDREALEEEIGKSLDELTQVEARHWNGQFMRRGAEEKPPKRPIDRKRAYLPEGVDGFELAYLQEQQEAGVPLHITLFDGQTFEGPVVGFGPYHILIREPDGDQVTLNKLAIAYYRKSGGAE
ncbi:MAG TPA: helix-turn-helix domain-containing protein [Chloroflexi bacterium]|nr:helix-turn-helix domain-containing protein [Chloroflexota bacterium]